MPKSRVFLPDVNVWLALASRRHIHYRIATSWLESVTDDQVAFCRITQMGLLRLLTNPAAMRNDVLSQRDAWKVYRQIAADARMVFLPEPLGIESVWRELTHSSRPHTNIWTDAYLQAFSSQSDAQVVSFDRGFLRFGDAPRLGPPRRRSVEWD